MFAIGWFMKTRVAFLVNLGTIVGWFFLVPLVVWSTSIYDAISQSNIPIQQYAGSGGAPLQMIAFSVVRTIAIGAIVGGGMFGLARCKTFLNIFSDIGGALKGEGNSIWKARDGMNGHLSTYQFS